MVLGPSDPSGPSTVPGGVRLLRMYHEALWIAATWKDSLGLNMGDVEFTAAAHGLRQERQDHLRLR
jgi:hypothetical protein